MLKKEEYHMNRHVTFLLTSLHVKVTCRHVHLYI